MEQKPILFSKTAWLNIILAVLVIAYPAGHDFMVANPEGVATFFTVMNVILRLISRDKVTLW